MSSPSGRSKDHPGGNLAELKITQLKPPGWSLDLPDG